MAKAPKVEDKTKAAAANAKAEDEARRAADANANAGAQANDADQTKRAAAAEPAAASSRRQRTSPSNERRWFTALSPILDGADLVEVGGDIAVTRSAYDALKAGSAIDGEWDVADVAD